MYSIYGIARYAVDPEVKRSDVKVTQLQKHRGHMAAAACGRHATAAGLGLHVV